VVAHRPPVWAFEQTLARRGRRDAAAASRYGGARPPTGDLLLRKPERIADEQTQHKPMDDKPQLFNTTRRQLLAGMGAVGLASAGAGLGTTAYFNDTESFEGNNLQAGEFDLKVDWQHMYYGAMQDGIYASAGRPYVSAFPDADEDGVRDEFLTRGELAAEMEDDETSQAVEDAYRAQFADVPNDFESPLIALDDVKPGDSGCLSLSMHLFDNPGHIWLGTENVSASENGQSEPEAEVDETAQGAGELAESMNARVWYDDGNCELDSGFEGETAEVVAVLDRSGSMDDDTGNPATSAKWNGAKDGVETLVDALAPNTPSVQFGLASYSSSATVDQALTTDPSDIDAALGTLSTGGSTDIESGLAAADGMFSGTADSEIVVVLTNGNETTGDAVGYAAGMKSDGKTIYTIAYGSNANAGTLSQVSSGAAYSYLATELAAIEQVFAAIGQSISGEEVIVDGTMADVVDALETGVHLDGNRVDEEDQCFVNSTTQYIAIDWEVPTTVGNEIQTDSLEFDLSLVAEQCRHNDAPENPFAPESTPTPTQTATDTGNSTATDNA
jgi:Ca-activated chloride channel family protein